MPIKDYDKNTLYIDGRPFLMQSIESNRVFNKETKEEMLPYFTTSRSFSATMKFKNTMNRVRFVRALIRLGYSKKEAKQIAKQTKKPYYIAWWDYFDKKRGREI